VAEQVISALSGQEPMAWPGADAEHFAQQLDHAAREAHYDVGAVVEGERTAIVVDGQNRILGISSVLAAEIGWDVGDLLGRRVVAIVPPQFREAHVAGLTRHLSTGQAHALRVDCNFRSCVLTAPRCSVTSGSTRTAVAAVSRSTSPTSPLHAHRRRGTQRTASPPGRDAASLSRASPPPVAGREAVGPRGRSGAGHRPLDYFGCRPAAL
jgi:hypothetical protein